MVSGRTPYMFEENAERVGSKVLVKSSNYSAPYDSLEHLIGSASGWGMQKGKISNSVHFTSLYDPSSDKISFGDLELYITKEEYDRLVEIIQKHEYTREHWTKDAQMYLSKYAINVPSAMMNTIADEFFNDGFKPKCFQNGFYAIESQLCEVIGIDPKELVKDLFSGANDKGFWKSFYTSCQAWDIKVISKLPRK